MRRVALVCASAAAASRLDALLPLGDDANYAIRVHPPLSVAAEAGADAEAGAAVAAALAGGEPPFPIVDADGEAYACYLPPRPAAVVAAAAAPHASALDPAAAAAAARARVLDAKLAAVRAVLAPAAAASASAAAAAAGAASASAPASAMPTPPPPPPCVAKTAGYWTYQLCPGASLKQYRLESSGSADATAASSPPALSFSLGAFTHDEVAVAPGGLVYRQHFADGTAGRAAVVAWECDGDAAAALPPGVASDIARVSEPAPLAYEVAVATRDRAVCGAVPSNAALLAPLNGTLLRHIDGWWTYELRLGGEIAQYHDGGGGKREAESVIGVYNWAAGERVEPPGPGRAGALVQRYTGGSACGVRGGEPRSAVVRFECAPPGTGGPSESVSPGEAGGARAGSAGATLGLTGIREPSTCEYEVTLTTSAACGHPDVAPTGARARAAGRGGVGAGGDAGGAASQPPPSWVHCFADPASAAAGEGGGGAGTWGV